MCKMISFGHQYNDTCAQTRQVGGRYQCQPGLADGPLHLHLLTDRSTSGPVCELAHGKWHFPVSLDIGLPPELLSNLSNPRARRNPSIDGCPRYSVRTIIGFDQVSPEDCQNRTNEAQTTSKPPPTLAAFTGETWLRAEVNDRIILTSVQPPSRVKGLGRGCQPMILKKYRGILKLSHQTQNTTNMSTSRTVPLRPVIPRNPQRLQTEPVLMTPRGSFVLQWANTTSKIRRSPLALNLSF